MDSLYHWLIAAGVVINIIAGVWYAIWIVANWKIFEKAGEKGWKAIIPCYNLYVQYSFTWKAYMAIPVIVLGIAGGLMMQLCTGGWQTFGSFIALAGTIISIIGLSKLSKAFGRGTGFTLGLIFLNPIFILILGFGKDKFVGTPKKLSN